MCAIASAQWNGYVSRWLRTDICVRWVLCKITPCALQLHLSWSFVFWTRVSFRALKIWRKSRPKPYVWHPLSRVSNMSFREVNLMNDLLQIFQTPINSPKKWICGTNMSCIVYFLAAQCHAGRTHVDTVLLLRCVISWGARVYAPPAHIVNLEKFIEKNLFLF